MKLGSLHALQQSRLQAFETSQSVTIYFLVVSAIGVEWAMAATKGRGTSPLPAHAARTQNSSTCSEIDAFLADVKSRVATAAAGDRGRLLFAMDATMSRQPTWDRALAFQAEMFRETARIGGLDVQLSTFAASANAGHRSG